MGRNHFKCTLLVYDKVYYKKHYANGKSTKYKADVMNQTMFNKMLNMACFTTVRIALFMHIIYIDIIILTQFTMYCVR